MCCSAIIEHLPHHDNAAVCPPTKTRVQSAFKAVLSLGLSKAEQNELAAILMVEAHDDGDVIVRAAGRTC